MTSHATRALAAATISGSAALAWGLLVEPRLFALRRYVLPVLSPGSRPVRVLQVSDIHMVPGQDAKSRWIRGLADLEPDLVVNTGDNLSHLQAVPAALEAMRPLLDRPGVFVMGSNDYYAPAPKNPAIYLTKNYARSRAHRPLPTEDLRAGMTGHGWVDLDNARTTLEVAGQRLDLVGVDDPHIERDAYRGLSRPADPDAATTVGVVHAPYQRVLDAMAADGARVLIAGHTHGGQLCVPGYGALVTNCDLDRGRAKGVSRWWPGAGTATTPQPPDAAWLHVSAGLGASRFAPVRFACRPEASLLTLVPRGAE